MNVDEPYFCFVIASYNNEKNIRNNLNSVIRQTYKKWRVIYINDCSNDRTTELFHTMMEENESIREKFIYIENTKRMRQSYCKYKAYQLVKDLEIVCILDGDDWLSKDTVLSTLKEYYKKKYMVITSNYNVYKNGEVLNNVFPSKYTIDELKNIRMSDKWLFKHLKTGYGILFKSIPEHYLQYNNTWLTMVTDVAEMTCVTEFSNANVLCVDDVLYTYNYDNSILYPSSYYNSKDDIHRKLIHDHIKQLPKCNYGFPPIYIINLKEDTKKREQMIKQLELIQSHSFVEAVKGDINGRLYENYLLMFDSKIYPKNKYCLHKKHIIPGSLGLLQSVFKLLASFVESELEHILILEDDVFTLKNFYSSFFINEKLLKDKDLVYLGCHSSRDVIYKSAVNDKDVYIDIQCYPYLIYGTYSIIISKKVAKYILNFGLENIIDMNLSWDLFLNYMRETTEFSFFLYFKQLFIPDVMKDGIQPKRDIDFYTKNQMILDDYHLHEPIFSDPLPTPEPSTNFHTVPKPEPVSYNTRFKLNFLF